MTNRELQLILAKARNERRGGAPHEDWVVRNRDIMMMQVRNTTDRNVRNSFLDAARNFVSVFVPAEQLFATARAVAVFVLMVGTVLGGGLATVVAYRDSVPGQASYNVKLAVEKAQVFLAPNDAYRVWLHVDFADRRLEEAANLAEGPESKRHLAVGVLEDFNSELIQLHAGLLGLKAIDPEGVAQAAKMMDRKMISYQQTLRGVVRGLPADVRPKAMAVANRVEGLGLQAMAMLLEQHLAGDVNAPKEMVASKINDRIRQAEAQLTVADQKSGGAKSVQAKEAIAEAKTLMEEENYQAAFSKMVEVAELTKEDETEVPAEPETVSPVDGEASDVKTPLVP